MIFTAGFFAAVIGAMGMGGGGVLLLYLAAFTDTPQLTAQGINLLFFLPIAALSMALHFKNRLLRWRIAGFTVLTAVPGAVLGAVLSGTATPGLLRKALAVFLLCLGVGEVVGSFRKKEEATVQSSKESGDRPPAE